MSREFYRVKTNKSEMWATLSKDSDTGALYVIEGFSSDRFSPSEKPVPLGEFLSADGPAQGKLKDLISHLLVTSN
ncbi:hypothetical protein P6U16_01230 [Rhizobium sp. 32-5/1]|uniref:hypothetical protein n=1 Tax=Rhizobium sp. 32-5/1 TaxID=3019602 RepID=UPI00240D8C90|nr:hypothetical protein [Rhizobium sp. 32-5/1]WEZ83508.1 hypothetical protein P6U16_01230 [Rhizobium sp. 32-5/1]